MSNLTRESIIGVLPEVLSSDPTLYALATAMADELSSMASSVKSEQIYTHIDSLDESLLDILAEDFKVDWWRPDATIEEKRATLKASWYVHRHTGTRVAIETAISDFIGSGRVEEWFEYGGKPYHFRISDGNNELIRMNYQTFLNVIAAVSRGSSVLDAVTALLRHSHHIHVGIAVRSEKTETVGCAPVSVNDLFSMLTNARGDILTNARGDILIL